MDGWMDNIHIQYIEKPHPEAFYSFLYHSKLASITQSTRKSTLIKTYINTFLMKYQVHEKKHLKQLWSDKAQFCGII